MSSVVEIESAIEKLNAEELIELSAWLEPRMRQIEAKREALNEVGGYLTAADDDFVAAVIEAGKDVACDE